jgi:hypothetical protein
MNDEQAQIDIRLWQVGRARCRFVCEAASTSIAAVEGTLSKYTNMLFFASAPASYRQHTCSTMDDASIPSMDSSMAALRTSAFSRFRRAVNVLSTRCANRGSIDATPRSMSCTFALISCSSVGFGGGASSFFSVFFSSVLFISTSCIVDLVWVVEGKRGLTRRYK